MKLYTAHRAPSPRRVLMFLVEKNITGIEMVHLDLNGGEHRQPEYLAKSPLAKVPALELHDGRVITETRAICTLLEGRVTFHHIESNPFSAFRSHPVFGILEPVRFRHLQAS